MGALVEEAIRAAIAALVDHDADAGPRGHQGRRPDQRGAARTSRNLIARTIATQSPVARDLRLPADARPRDLRARADGRPRRLGREAGPQARAGAAARAVRRTCPRWASSAPRWSTASCGRWSTSTRSRPGRSRPATTRSTTSTTRCSTSVVELMRADPANVERGHAILLRGPLHRADRRPGHEHRRGRRVPRDRRGRGPEPMTARRRRRSGCSLVCTGNSARSLMAEALLRRERRRRFEVHSAGTHPKGVNPLTLRVLGGGRDRRLMGSLQVGRRVPRPVVRLRDHGVRRGAPGLPGASRAVRESLHWGYEDPAEADGHRGGAPGRLPAGVHPAERTDRGIHPARDAAEAGRRDGLDAAAPPAYG